MFSRATLGFLDDLAANNNRAWFDANRLRYESEVREPALEFIAAMGPVLQRFAGLHPVKNRSQALLPPGTRAGSAPDCESTRR